MSLDRPDYSGMVNIDTHTAQVLYRVEQGRDDIEIATGAAGYVWLKTIAVTGLSVNKVVTHCVVEIRVSAASTGDVQLRSVIDGGAEVTLHTFTTTSLIYEFLSHVFAAHYGTVVEFRFYGRNTPGGAPPSTALRVTRVHGDELRFFVYV